MAILILLFAVIFFACQKKVPLSFDKDNTSILKAILPYFIILHHSFMDVSEFRSLGIYVVALFFFVSGYGLERKRLRDNNIEWGGVLLRYKRVLLPVILPLVIYLLLVFLRQDLTWNWVVERLADYTLVMPHSWFVLSLCQLYLMYYLSWAIFKEKSLHAFAVLLTIYVGALYATNVQSTYYCSLYGFLAGILFMHVIPRIQQYGKYAWMGIFGLLLVYLLIHLQLPMTSLYNTVIFVFSATVILSAVITKGRMIKFFSNISYEVYLCQGIGFLIAGLICKDSILVFFVTILITTTCAYICHELTMLIFGHQLKLSK